MLRENGSRPTQRRTEENINPFRANDSIASLRLPGPKGLGNRRLMVLLMKTHAALFIDGSNFYHSLKAEGHLPFNAEHFNELFSQLSDEFELRRIFFYDALKDRIKDPEGYARQQKFHSSLSKLKVPLRIKTRKLRYLANLTREEVDAAATEVGIVDACREKLWALLQRLGLIRLTKEKGVDVLLVVDAIEEARENTTETIILLSGDADFVPAINLIRKNGLKTVNLHTYSGSSNELRNCCDRHILIDFDSSGLFLE